MNGSLAVHCMKGSKPCTLNYRLILSTKLHILVILSCRVNPRSQPPVRLWSWGPSPALKVERDHWVWWRFHQISPSNELHLCRELHILNPCSTQTWPKATEYKSFNLSVCRKGTEMRCCTHRKSLLPGCSGVRTGKRNICLVWREKVTDSKNNLFRNRQQCAVQVAGRTLLLGL